MEFDFKKYHMRAINAPDEATKQAINQELKAYYQTLNMEERFAFNTQLQTFIAKEMGRLKTDYEAIKSSNLN